MHASHAAAAALLPRIQAAGDQLAVSPRKACEMLGCGMTRLYEKLKSGKLASYKDGYSRKIIVASIRDDIAECIKASATTP